MYIVKYDALKFILEIYHYKFRYFGLLIPFLKINFELKIV